MRARAKWTFVAPATRRGLCMCTRTPGRPTDASASLFHMGEAYFLLPRPRVHSIRTNSCKHKNTSGFTVKTCFRHLHGQRAVHTHNAATVILRVCVCGKCAPVVSRNECEPRTREARSARHYLVCTERRRGMVLQRGDTREWVMQRATSL